MPVPVAVYDAIVRETMANELIDMLFDSNVPSDHVIYLAWNMSSQGYRVGNALATLNIDAYSTEEMIIITGRISVTETTEVERQSMHQSLLESIQNLITEYTNAP